MSRLFQRNGVYYVHYKDHNGVWKKRSTGCIDKVAAKAKQRDIEREAADPTYRAANDTSLADAIDDFIASRRRKGNAQPTIDMYEKKLGHVARLVGDDTTLARIDSSTVDSYIDVRLAEGASRSTIGKELTSIRGMLKVAKRAGKYPPDISAVMPNGWATDYETRERALTAEEVELLLRNLAAPREKKDRWGNVRVKMGKERNSLNQAACVAWMIATGCRLGEALRAERGDVDLKNGLVFVRGSKTAKSRRYVPITRLTRPLIDQVLAATAGRRVLFDRWSNIQRDLADACEEIGIDRCSPNDLRRTHSNWLRDAGVDNSTIADVLGHVDSRMVDRVYGRLRPEQLAARVKALLG